MTLLLLMRWKFAGRWKTFCWYCWASLFCLHIHSGRILLDSHSSDAEAVCNLQSMYKNWMNTPQAAAVWQGEKCQSKRNKVRMKFEMTLRILEESDQHLLSAILQDPTPTCEEIHLSNFIHKKCVWFRQFWDIHLFLRLTKPLWKIIWLHRKSITCWWKQKRKNHRWILNSTPYERMPSSSTLKYFIMPVRPQLAWPSSCLYGIMKS